eukprot:m.40861 g.40861  ORF g.40861 m.40861 type:complete len:576 (-) comp18636_c0_seq1:16-1743(-)
MGPRIATSLDPESGNDQTPCHIDDIGKNMPSKKGIGRLFANVTKSSSVDVEKNYVHSAGHPSPSPNPNTSEPLVSTTPTPRRSVLLRISSFLNPPGFVQRKLSKPDFTDAQFEPNIFSIMTSTLQGAWQYMFRRRLRSKLQTTKMLALMLFVGMIISRVFMLSCSEFGTLPFATCQATTTSFKPLGSFAIVTACSKAYFDQLENFIGSMHFWEPNQKILVYDIGLSPEQLTTLSCYVDVSVKPFPFDSQPDHVVNLYNYAWKILAVEDALKQFNSVLMLDSGVELRAPLITIKEIMVETGHFSTIQPGTVYSATHENTFRKLGVDPDHPQHKQRWSVPFYAGGIQGFAKNSIATTKVLPLAVECAKSEACIHPEGAGRNNHNYDQSVFSILLRENGFVYSTNVSERFASFQPFRWTLDATRCDNYHVLGLRKYQFNKVYKGYVRKLAFCAKHVKMSATKGQVVESLPNQRLDGSSPLLHCLHDHHNQIAECQTYIQENGLAWLKHAYLLQKTGFLALTWVRTMVFCPVTCLLRTIYAGLIAVVALLAWRTLILPLVRDVPGDLQHIFAILKPQAR